MKKVMRKVLVHGGAFSLLAFALTGVTFAAAVGSGGGMIPNPIKAKSLSELFDNIVSVCIELGTILSVLGIIYGGFQYVTAQGNEEKLSQAQKTVTWALVGTAVLLGARTIMVAVRSTVEQLGKGV